MEILIGVLCGMFFSIVPVWAYRRGIKDAKRINDNLPIEDIKTPLQTIEERKEIKEEKIKNDKVRQGMINILNYTGEPQKDGEE